MDKNYKTIHENKVLINPPTECIEFDGNLAFPEQQPTLIEVLNNLENYILSLQRYEPEPKNDWVQMIENKDGEWVKISDVLALFRGTSSSAKK